ncbi:MAG: Xaa-Pro peptidase family protein [Elusimicrobiota bacterium]
MPEIKLKSIQNKLQARKIECFLVCDPMDLFYLTGINLQGGYWIVVTAKKAAVITSEMLYQQVSDLLPGFEVIKSRKFVETLKTILKTEKIKVLTLDSKKMSWELGNKLQKAIKKVKCVHGFFESLREIKTENEILLIKKSCAIVVNVFNEIRKELRPGMTEIAIADRIMELLYKNGTGAAFTPIVAGGINSGYPHHINSEYAIKNNDLLIIDLGARLKGYCSDLTRTVILGKIPELCDKVYNLVKLAHNEAIAAVKPGIKASFVDKKARFLINKEGFGKEFTHGTGHGVGPEVHELPSVNSTGNAILKPGMVITVEPGIYIKNNFGARMEDTVLVTENGREILTRGAK